MTPYRFFSSTEGSTTPCQPIATSDDLETLRSDIKQGIPDDSKTQKRQKAAPTKERIKKIVEKRKKGGKLTPRELSYLSDYLSSASSSEDSYNTTVSTNKTKYQTEKIIKATKEDKRQVSQNEGSESTTLKDNFGDMSEFKKSTKGAEVNLKAATREMPDPAVLERIRESGVNEAMRDY